MRVILEQVRKRNCIKYEKSLEIRAESQKRLREREETSTIKYTHKLKSMHTSTRIAAIMIKVAKSTLSKAKYKAYKVYRLA